MAIEEQKQKQEQAKTSAMVMRQDVTEQKQLTTPDHPAIDDASQSDITSKQHETESAQQETTPATSEHVIINETQPLASTTDILTVQVLCPRCSTTNNINIYVLWQRDIPHRFVKPTCT